MALLPRHSECCSQAFPTVTYCCKLTFIVHRVGSTRGSSFRKDRLFISPSFEVTPNSTTSCDSLTADLPRCDVLQNQVLPFGFLCCTTASCSALNYFFSKEETQTSMTARPTSPAACSSYSFPLRCFISLIDQTRTFVRYKC